MGLICFPVFTKLETLPVRIWRDHYVLHEIYHAHVLFYVNILNDHGKNVQFKHWENLLPGDMVVTHQKNIQDRVEMNYLFEENYSNNNIKIYKINGRKYST